MQEVWKELDQYFGDLLAPSDPILDDILTTNRRENLVPQDVSRPQGKLLEILVRISGTKRILEIGTLGAYSTVWFARTIPPEGHIVTLEVNKHHAEVASANLRLAGMDHKVDLRVGTALDLMAELAAEDIEPFDLIFLDADKRNNPGYLKYALQMSHPGTIILADNVVRSGRVAETDSDDADVRGVREFTEMVAAEPRLSATVVQTVGSKGYDGFMLAVVKA
jgi:predicted O-methyltransferase YrrM